MAAKGRRRPTDEEYAEMAADYAANPVRPDEVIGAVPNPMKMGRPAKGTSAVGKTPAMAVRLPTEIRAEIKYRVRTGESGSESELVRVAVTEYLHRHPRTG